MTRWIRTDVKFPRTGKYTIGWDSIEKEHRKVYYHKHNDCWYDELGECYLHTEITHWQPLPDPPKKRKP